jgi:hypothetical protein
MSRDVSPVLSESFEDVLCAVQETARGRWFLDQYSERRRSEDTAAILAAIAKLEIAISRMSPAQQKAEPDVLTRAKSAIADAKQQIRGIVTVESPLSKEAQLFAKLAELSRQALAAAPDDVERKKLGASMEVALKLVSDLEDSFAAHEPVAKQAVSGQKFFHQDAEIFEPVKAKDTELTSSVKIQTAQKPTASAAENPDVSLRGARVILSRTGNAVSTPKFETHELVQASVATADLGEISATKATIGMENKKTTKIDFAVSRDPKLVTINRKPDDTIGVPLFDDGGDEENKDGTAS